ncbi:transposable element Tcb2 transposase [Trichonephila clavipes]|nr:transposable element Tcb2 transposase [Trichonephila clavipes]
MLLRKVESLGSWRKAAVGQVWLQSSELLTASFHEFGDNFKLQEQLSGGFSSGRPLETTPSDDRYFVLQARRNWQQTAGEIAGHTTQATGRPISRFTVARSCTVGGLFAQRPVRCVSLTPAHRREAFSVVPGTPELERL